MLLALISVSEILFRQERKNDARIMLIGMEKTDYQDGKMTRRDIVIGSICKSNQRVQAALEAV